MLYMCSLILAFTTSKFMWLVSFVFIERNTGKSFVKAERYFNPSGKMQYVELEFTTIPCKSWSNSSLKKRKPAVLKTTENWPKITLRRNVYFRKVYFTAFMMSQYVGPKLVWISFSETASIFQNLNTRVKFPYQENAEQIACYLSCSVFVFIHEMRDSSVLIFLPFFSTSDSFSSIS